MKKQEVIDHIVRWLLNYSDQSKTSGFVIGILVGIDSAVTSTLCAKTRQPVICLNMPIHQHKEEYNLGHEHIHCLQNQHVDYLRTAAVMKIRSVQVMMSWNGR